MPTSLKALRLLLVWLALTAISTTIYLADSDPLRSISNILQMLTVPGWIVVRLATWRTRINVEAGAVVSNALGWAFWLWLALRLQHLRKRLLAREPRPSASPANPSRRRLLVDAPASLAVLSGGAALADAGIIEPWALTVPRYRIPIQGLPAGLDGLRLVQLSDTHLGPRVPLTYLRSVVERALSLNPDVFLLTGDYIHNGTAYIEAGAALFRPLVETGKPVIGVLGNHDWYGNGPAVSRALQQTGVRMIDNDRVILTPSRRLGITGADGVLCIAGLGDLREDVVDPERALGRLPAAMPRLVLAHNPDSAELPILTARGAPRIDLMLSGHTHGGQVALPFLGTPIVPSSHGQKYAGGLVQGPAFPVLISRGIGMSLIPVRLGVPPELVEITLTRA